MTNPLNHFSDVGKHVLAAKIKVMLFDSKNTANMPNAKNVENHSLWLKGVMSVTRDQSSYIEYLLSCLCLRIVITGLLNSYPDNRCILNSYIKNVLVEDCRIWTGIDRE